MILLEYKKESVGLKLWGESIKIKSRLEEPIPAPILIYEVPSTHLLHLLFDKDK